MKKSEYYQLLDLLKEIKGVDKMIKLHKADDSNFMLDQYKAKKQKLVSNFIDQLASPLLISTKSIHTIKMAIDRFYGEEMKSYDQQTNNDELAKLELALV